MGKKEWIFKSKLAYLGIPFGKQINLAKKEAICDFINKNEDWNNFTISFKIESLSTEEIQEILDSCRKPDFTFWYEEKMINWRELKEIIENNTGYLLAKFEENE